jgi:hypothetical protein
MSYHVKVPAVGMLVLSDRGQWSGDTEAAQRLVQRHINTDGVPGHIPDPAWWEANRMAEAVGGFVVEDQRRRQPDPHAATRIY